MIQTIQQKHINMQKQHTTHNNTTNKTIKHTVNTTYLAFQPVVPITNCEWDAKLNGEEGDGGCELLIQKVITNSYMKLVSIQHIVSLHLNTQINRIQYMTLKHT
jgi:hypothetical protein